MVVNKIITQFAFIFGVLTLATAAQADAPHRFSRPYSNSPMGYSASTYRGVPWARPNYSNSYSRNQYSSSDRFGRDRFGNGYGWGRNGGNSILTQGFRDGRLSRDEFSELREKREDLRRQERSYWADGRLSKNERKELREDYKDYRSDLKHELKDGERREFRDRGWRR